MRTSLDRNLWTKTIKKKNNLEKRPEVTNQILRIEEYTRYNFTYFSIHGITSCKTEKKNAKK